MGVASVILCGGSGTRLWPLSSNDSPKQFLKLKGQWSLFQDTCMRIESDKLVVVTKYSQVDMVSDQLKEIKHSTNSLIIGETSSRNTAPAIAAAASKLDPADIMVVMPSDHIIENKKEFNTAIKNAIEIAKSGMIVTIGITPTEPNSNYGYIIRQESSDRIERFVEKPTLNEAKSLIEHDALINSGIYIMTAKTYLDEYSSFDTASYTNAIEAVRSTPEANVVVTSLCYTDCDSKSIDYAIMEKTDKGYVIPTTHLCWSDIGTFESLHNTCKSTAENNTAIGKNICTINTHDSLIANKTNKKVIVYGMDNISVVETDDVVLVTPLKRANELMELMKVLKS